MQSVKLKSKQPWPQQKNNLTGANIHPDPHSSRRNQPGHPDRSGGISIFVASEISPLRAFGPSVEETRSIVEPQALAELASAEADVEKAEADLARTVIRAP